MVVAHGTIYDLPHEPFIAFDLMRMRDWTSGNDYRVLYDEFLEKVDGQFVTAAEIHRGSPISIDDVMGALGDHGFHNAIDPPEGAVWRVERDGKVEFLVKFVRDGKIDGCYLGEDVVWNNWKGKPQHL